MSRTYIRYRVTGLDSMRDYFRHDLSSQIDGTKLLMRAILARWDGQVQGFNVPIGPSHRKDVAEGTLRASVQSYTNDRGDEFEHRVSVGDGTDYWFYVNARDGVDFWRGEDDVIEAIDGAMRGDFDGT